jgi:hypothetical protein
MTNTHLSTAITNTTNADTHPIQKEYRISYNHRSTETATSKDQALQMVRAEARVSRLALAETSDGIYCYASQEDKDRDDTGARAFAVICTAEQD